MLLIILAVLGGLALLVTSVSIIAIMFLLIQSIRDQRDILTLEKINTARVGGMEKLLITIHTMLVSEIAQANMPPAAPDPSWSGMQIGHRDGKFVTEDGRYEADTFEELIKKISSDPQYRIAKDEDVDKLREQFEDHARESGEETGEEPEDEDDEWKEGDPEKNES